ncbi:MAG: hypothetical protein ACR2K5_05470 [Pseudolabrys sp.]
MLPKIPSRTDAFVQCDCGGTMSIQTVEPIPEQPDKMRHTYKCLDCGKEAQFEVDKKKPVGPSSSSPGA